MKLQLQVNLDNAAFAAVDDRPDHRSAAPVADVLHKVAKEIAQQWSVREGDVFAISDSNGNTVGHYRILP